MAKRFLICFLLLVESLFFGLYSQNLTGKDPSLQILDTLPSAEDIRTTTLPLDVSRKMIADISRGDTLQTAFAEHEKAYNLSDSLILSDSITKFKNKEFKPNSKKAVIYSAIFPGMGQLYNRKYWKLPIVYGGFMGFAYAISWNGGMYNDYKLAYKDLLTGEGNSWESFISNPNIVSNNKSKYLDDFRRAKEFYKRNRDLAIILAAAFYGLCMLDAYVDAQLFDFDISPDLTMRVQPILIAPTLYSERSLGLQFNIYF